MFLKDASEVGLLFIAEIKANFFQGITLEDSAMSFTHPMFFEPPAESAAVMFAEVALDSAETDTAESGNALRTVVRLAREFTPA